MFEAFEFLGRYLLLAIQWVNNSFIHDIALSTIIFTVIIKLIALPADVKQRQSMAKMTALNPELQKLQKRYESNPETLQRKTQELYKKTGASPYSSCLPMIVTMLIFMIFLGAMRTWSYVGSIDIYQEAKVQQAIAAEEGTPLVVVQGDDKDHLKEYKWAWVHNIWMPDSFLEGSVMEYKQFSQTPFSKLNLFFDESTLATLSEVSEQEYNDVMRPYMDAYAGVRNGWGILPILAAGSMLLIQFIQSKLNPAQTQAQPNPASGKTMMIVMAVFSGYICFNSNTAFSLYWLASNVVSLFTSLLLTRYTNKKTAELEAEQGNIIA